MSALVAPTVLLLVGAAILLGALTLAATGEVRVALAVLVDLLLAAALLRLSSTQSWPAIVAAAATVAIRVAIWLALPARPRRPPYPSGTLDPSLPHADDPR